jgi:hypothetical protein
MNRRTVVLVVIVAAVGVFGVLFYFHGHQLWNALLVMHGRRAS